MVKVQKLTDLELEEDYFEEFELNLPTQDTDMKGKNEEKEDDEIYGEAEKWDDDDIEEDFSAVLKKEIKMEQTEDFDIDAIAKQEILNREVKRQKRKEREEALAKKEQELLDLDKTLDIKRTVYASYALEPIDPAVKKKKVAETKDESTGNDAVESYFNDLPGVPDIGVVKEEFIADLKPRIYRKKDISLAQQRDNLQETDKDLKKKEKQVSLENKRFLRNREISVVKLLGDENASEETKQEKIQEETAKVLATRQNKRRRAAYFVAKDNARSAKKVSEMDRAVLIVAKQVAFAEAVEEDELVVASVARPASANPKKSLPYKAEKGDDIDAAVGKVLTAAKLNCGFKLIKGKGVRNPCNTRSYVFQNGDIVRVKSVFQFVLANDGSGAQWTALKDLLESKC
mmetsp:Transcript_30634/g.42685  ORF Transcript_30634/g.42685 Transcript_30634/m.42685 type:complete len:401 (+) Transcript_30634:30-1232(+)